MATVVVLNRAFRVLTRIFFAIVALGVGTIFLLMPLAALIKAPGGPALQRLFHSDGFFPWPVAAIFYLGGFAPWLIGVGLAGAVIGGVLRRMLFSNSEQVLADVISVGQTGTTVNSRPQMRLKLRLGAREITLKALIDLGAVPRPGDRVRVLVSRADPSFMKYAGLA